MYKAWFMPYVSVRIAGVACDDVMSRWQTRSLARVPCSGLSPVHTPGVLSLCRHADKRRTLKSCWRPKWENKWETCTEDKSSEHFHVVTLHHYMSRVSVFCLFTLRYVWSFLGLPLIAQLMNWTGNGKERKWHAAKGLPGTDLSIHCSLPRGSTCGCSQNCSWTQLVRHTPIQPIRALYLSFHLHSREYTAMFVFREISGKAIPLITKNYVILTKRNILTRQRTTLETWQALFCFCFLWLLHLERTGAFSKSLSTDLCGVDLRFSSLSTTQHNTLRNTGQKP